MATAPTSPSDAIRLRSGAEMPVIGLGTWQLTDDTAGTVRTALELGYRMIDTSGDYGTQPGIAEALRETDVPREELYVVTKVEQDEDAYEATKDCLRELDVQHVDLMLIHRPPARGAGVELWRGLQRARDEGLVRDIGVSNYSIEEMEELARESGEVPAVNQIEWTPFGWSRDMLDHCREGEILIQAYSPLTRAEWLDDQVLQDVAERCGATPAQVLIRWNLDLGVVPLPKANQVDHLRENLGAFDVDLSDEDVRSLEERNEHRSALGSTLQYT